MPVGAFNSSYEKNCSHFMQEDGKLHTRKARPNTGRECKRVLSSMLHTKFSKIRTAATCYINTMN